MTKAMIDAFFEARDLLSELKNAHQHGDDEIEESRVKAVCDRLKSLSSDDQSVETDALFQKLIKKKLIKTNQLKRFFY